MATQRVAPREIGEEIRRALRSGLEDTLPADSRGNRLITCAIGSLDYFPASIPADVTPAIFVKPVSFSPTFHGTGHKMYETTYTYRIVYVRQFKDAEEVVSVKLQAAQLLVDELMDNLLLPGLADPSGSEAFQVIWTLPRSIDLEPAEETTLDILENEDMIAVAVEFDVKVLSRR